MVEKSDNGIDKSEGETDEGEEIGEAMGGSGVDGPTDLIETFLGRDVF